MLNVLEAFIFLNSTKSYLEIIKNSDNKESALYNFPKYLFAEKEIFLNIYKKTDKDKLIKIYKNLILNDHHRYLKTYTNLVLGQYSALLPLKKYKVV